MFIKLVIFFVRFFFLSSCSFFYFIFCVNIIIFRCHSLQEPLCVWMLHFCAIRIMSCCKMGGPYKEMYVCIFVAKLSTQV